MVAMLEELFEPLDADVDTALGWRPSALPSWWMALPMGSSSAPTGDRRAQFLEERTGRLLCEAFPAAHVETSLVRVDPADGREYETDAVALVDPFAVVAEAKAGRLGSEARRGRGRQLRDRIDALLVEPSEQAERFADFLIGAAGQPTLRRRTDGGSVTIDAGWVRRALTVGVTLEPMAALLPRLADVAEAGLSKRTADALS